MVPQYTVYLPPEDSFFPFNASGIFQSGGYRIILTRETSHKHICLRYLCRIYPVDVDIGMSFRAKLITVYY